MYNNNYGYNPYGAYIPQRPLPQPMDMKQFLNGKVVDSLEVVKATDIPLDGSISYFPLMDNTAIITKQLQNDGTSKITIFKPITEAKADTRYVTEEEVKKALSELNLSELEDIKEEIEEIKQQLREFKRKKKDD